jgi:sugar phosphate isomerase/epimerase
MLTLATKFTPERQAFDAASAAGFRAAEFWVDAELLSRSNDFAALASEYPFRYALHFPNHGPIGPDTLTSAVHLYNQTKATAMIIHQPMFDRYGAALRELAPGLDLAIENHILDLDGFERWAELNPGLTLDVEHLWKFTLYDVPLAKLLEHVDRFLRRHVHKLQHVHLPGYLPGGEEHHPIHHSVEMATGVLTRLADHGFNKLVVSELDLCFQTSEYLQQDVAMFEEWAQSKVARR